MNNLAENRSSSQIRIGKALEAVAASVSKVAFAITKFCAGFSALLIFIMASLIAFDILWRLITDRSFPEVLEIEQFLLSVVVFLSLAYTQTKGGHVKVDMFINKVSQRTGLVMQSIITLIGGFVFLIISWQNAIKAKDAYVLKELFYVSQVPIYPFVIIAAFGCALMVLVLLIEFIEAQSKIFQSLSAPLAWLLFILLVTAALIFLPMILKVFSVKMAFLTAGILGVAFLMLFLFLGFNIGVAMGFVGLIGTWYLKSFTAAVGSVNMAIFGAATDYVLIVIPFFVGMGFLCFAAGLSNELFSSALAIFGRAKGGLAISTIFGCAGFASICGDSMATAATMGSVAIPEMKKKKYQDSLATACVAAGGTLGILIPPSMGFIVYAIVTEQSIGKLFFAGIIPGILMASVFCLIIWIRCKRNPSLGPAGPQTTLVEKFLAVIQMWPILILFFVVMGGLWFGFFTAPEAGAVGLVGAVVIGLILKRYSFRSFFDALIQSVQITGMIFVIFFGVLILGSFITASEFPLKMAGIIQGLGINRYIVLTIILLIYVVLGCLMNIIPMIMLTLPMIYPTVIALGFDPIWFGVIMVIMMEMGQITPPVGINVFVIAGVAKDTPMYTIFRGIWPFIICQLIVIIILTLWPEIALYLPNSLQTLAAISD
ncbi:MAG: TRAP transporter large permease subunit [Deltaproteobacteria bacterium]|nr:TRAP transporter large permease subunit [Deltaproteobacteria bacterium]